MRYVMSSPNDPTPPPTVLDRRSGEPDRRVADTPVPVERRTGRRRRWDGIISFRLTAALHEDLAREALARDVPLSRVIRERLHHRSFVSQKR
jgi:hypothetical protein